MCPPIRVMIVDDHDMVRNGLVVLLEAFEDLDLAGVATNGQEAVQLCGEIETDVVLMDLIMPKMNGIAATRILRQCHSQVQVVALISFGDEQLLAEVMQAGATGYVFKNAPIDQIAGAIRAAARGAISRDSSPGGSKHQPGGMQSQGPKLPQTPEGRGL